jgi:hypothetical protein
MFGEVNYLNYFYSLKIVEKVGRKPKQETRNNRPKLVIVDEQTHNDVKRIQIALQEQTKMAVYERDIYADALRLGVEQIKRTVLV